MAAFLRHGAARTLGGSVLQRTKAAVTSPAVAEERRRLVPRRMFSTVEEIARREEVLRGIQQKKEEAYDALAMAERMFSTSCFRNKLLLQHLAVQIEPRPGDFQWRRTCFERKALTVLETLGLISLAYVVSTGVVRYIRKKVKEILA